MQYFFTSFYKKIAKNKNAGKDLCPSLRFTACHSLVISLVTDYLKTSVYLFKQYDPHHLMGKCHL